MTVLLDRILGKAPAPAPAQAALKKILVVGPSFRFLSGLSVYTCRLANALSEANDVSVLLLDRLIPQRFYPGGHRVGEQLTSLEYAPAVRMAGKLDWYWGLGIVRAARMLKRERPDMIILQWWTAATLHSYLALTIAARRLGIPVSIEFHETQDTGEAEIPGVATYCRKVMPRLLAMTRGALVHNDHDLELLEKTYGTAAIGKLRVEIAPHGPYDHLPVTATPSSETDTTETRLLFFGLIRPYKGLEDLVEAFNLLTPEDVVDFRLTVVGETWEGWQLPAQQIEASPYRHRIDFVNRYVSDEEAGAYFAEADAIVLPYRRGSASGPLQIAMSAGIHTVVYRVGGLVEAVRDYDGATLVEPGDVTALKDALLDLRSRRNDRFEDPHSWSATLTAVERLANTVVLT